MTTNEMTRNFKIAAGILGVSFAGALVYAGIHLGVNLLWVWFAVLLLPVGAFLINRYPVLLLTALLFVGNYKTHAANGVISLTDPTLVVTLLVAVATGWELLLILGGVRRMSLRQVFGGQGGGVVAFLALLCVIAISYLYTPVPAAGAPKLMQFAAFDTLAFFATFLLIKRERDFRQLIWAVVVLTIPVAVRLIFGIAHPTEQQLRGNADVTDIGAALLIGATILILLYYRLPERFGRFVAFAALPILGMGLIASMARGPILTLLIVIAVMMVLLPQQSVIRRSTLIVSLFMLIAVMVAALLWVKQLPGAQNRGPAKVAELSALARGTLDAGGTTSERVAYFKSSLRAFSQHPFTGVGLAGWPAFYGDTTVAYPHNFILEVAAEQGLLGFIALLALIAANIAAVLRLRKAGSEFVFVLPVFLFCILLNMVTGNIENRVLFFWMSAPLVVARLLRQKQKDSQLSSESVTVPVHYSFCTTGCREGTVRGRAK